MTNTELLLHLIAAREGLEELWRQNHGPLIRYALSCLCFAAGIYEGWLLKGNRQ